MPLNYKVTNCHINWSYRMFSLTNHLLSPSYFCANLINISHNQISRMLQICQKLECIDAISIVEQGRGLYFAERRETMSCNTLEVFLPL
jgi:hypothetical protein